MKLLSILLLLSFSLFAKNEFQLPNGFVSKGSGLIGNKGTASYANSSALLELYGTTKGILPTRMTSTQRNAISIPATGLMIYNTTDSQMQQWNGSSWVPVGIANIVSGTGLIGGGISTNVTLSLDPAYVWGGSIKTISTGNGITNGGTASAATLSLTNTAINNVVAGTGLSGGGTSSTVTLSLTNVPIYNIVAGSGIGGGGSGSTVTLTLTSAPAAGGGGSGLEAIELKSHLEKLGFFSPISNTAYVNESYVDTSNLIITLGKSYATANTTTIHLDNNKTLLDAMDATTGWTAISGGTLATDTTNFLTGTAGNKLSHTNLNGTNGMIKSTFAFNITNQKLRARLRLDTVSNISYVTLKVESTTNHNIYTNFPVVGLVAGWNWLELDPNSYSGTTGTFVPTLCTIISISITTTGAQTLVITADDICLVEKYLLPLPMQIQIMDSTNTELMTIASEDATEKGKYTLASALSNNYLTATSSASQRPLTITNGTGMFSTTQVGAASYVVYDIKRKYLSTALSNKTMDWSLRYYDQPYLVTAFPSTTAISLYSATDMKASFKTGDVVWLYKEKYSGIYNESAGDITTLTSNAIRLTLSGDATYSGTTISIANSGTNAHDVDALGTWYVVRESAQFAYWAGTKTANENIAVATPKSFLTSKNVYSGFPPTSGIMWSKIFSDDFNRADGVPGNGWTVVNDSGCTAWTILTNRLSFNTTGEYCSTRTIRSLENYNNFTITPMRISGQMVMYNTVTQSYTLAQGIAVGSANIILENYQLTPVATSGVTVAVRSRAANADSNVIQIYNGATLLSTTAFTVTQGTYFNYRFEVYKYGCKFKIWDAATAEPAAFTVTTAIPTGAIIGGPYLQIVSGYGYVGGSHGYNLHDNIVVENLTGGFILRGQEIGVTAEKLVTATKLTRQDATNQNPIVYQRDAIVY